jgi:hypothetical protein
VKQNKLVLLRVKDERVRGLKVAIVLFYMLFIMGLLSLLEATH